MCSAEMLSWEFCELEFVTSGEMEVKQIFIFSSMCIIQ